MTKHYAEAVRKRNHTIKKRYLPGILYQGYTLRCTRRNLQNGSMTTEIRQFRPKMPLDKCLNNSEHFNLSSEQQQQQTEQKYLLNKNNNPQADKLFEMLEVKSDPSTTPSQVDKLYILSR